MDIILASTSPYRRALLQRLRIPFTCVAPGVSEAALPNETAAELAGRLARAKAKAVASANPTAIVIGSDQTAAVNNRILAKPGKFEAAFSQLRECSGKAITFHTGLAVICSARKVDTLQVEPFEVLFRTLTDAEISAYLRAEEPYDCAGSFKVEGLGITLFEGLQGRDPTSLEGLPLIALSRRLREMEVTFY